MVGPESQTLPPQLAVKEQASPKSDKEGFDLGVTFQDSYAKRELEGSSPTCL